MREEISLFAKNDLYKLLALSVLVFAVNLYGIDALEFFRHTEADRTLISWEMAESGDYIVPRLTHSVILTKPPLYYWVVATWIKLTGSAEEWSVRFPSLIAAWLLVLSTFLFSRRSGFSSGQAFLAAFFLGTSGQFLYIANVAEIDMTFGLFSAVSLFALFLAVTDSSLLFFLLAYAGLGLALLTKGLPILFFFFAAQGLYVLHRWYHLSLKRFKDFIFLLGANGVGMLLLSVLVLPWLFGLKNAVGLDGFWAQTKVEVFERIVQDVRYQRGIFFYFGVIATGFAPWFLGCVLAGAAWTKRLTLQQSPARDYSSRYDLFVTYCLVVVGTIFVSLSLALGKSPRYLFPLIPFLSCLAAACFAFIWRGSNREWIFRVMKYLGVLFLTLLPFGIFALLYRLEISPMLVTVLAVLVFMTAIFFFEGGCQQDLISVLTAFALLAFSLRVGEAEVFAPLRNRTLSVKWIAEAINQELPPGARIYNLELFDRWLTYYLKRFGRESYRLETANLPDANSVNGRSYVLISDNEETWRRDEIKSVDPSSRVVQDFGESRDKYVLIEMSSAELAKLRFTKMFPTYPSVPWFSPGN